MRSIIVIGILIILSGCSSNKDTFWNTTRLLEVDREIYFVGEKLPIKIHISSEDNTTIRFYENFSNLTIWFTLLVPCEHDSTQLCNKIIGSPDYKRNRNGIQEYSIKPGNPFIKEVICEILEADDQIVIKIPELNYKAQFDKNRMNEQVTLRVHGHCQPIDHSEFDSLEDYFNTIEIEIRKTNANTM